MLCRRREVWGGGCGLMDVSTRVEMKGWVRGWGSRWMSVWRWEWSAEREWEHVSEGMVRKRLHRMRW